MAKKKKPAPRHLSLRDRAASGQAHQGGRLTAALINRLSQALFLDQDYAAALEFARLLASEGQSPEGAGCAQTVLAFLERRQGLEPPPLSLEPELPEPYQSLRAALVQPPPPGRPNGAALPAGF